MILRRVLLFVVLLATGSVALFLATSGDRGARTAAREKTVAQEPPAESARPAGPPGLVVKGRGDHQGDVPPGVEVRTGGPGKIASNREVRLPGGKVRLVPEHDIAWSDATPRADGSYELAGVVLRLWPEDPGADPQPIVRLTAQSMTVVAAQKDGELVLDRAHQMDLRGVVVTGLAGGEGRSAGRVTLETERLRARVGKTNLELETPDDRVPVALRGERGATAAGPPALQLLATGRGLRADLRTGSPSAGGTEAPRRSRVTVVHDVVVRGVAAEGVERFRLAGQGPLDLVEESDASWVCDLRGQASFRGRLATLSAGGTMSPTSVARQLEASGDSLRALVRQVDVGSAKSPDAVASDVWLRGGAEARLGGQRIRADLLEINLDPDGDPEALTATGSPELLLEDRDGKPVGRVTCDERATWRRPGLLLRPILAGLGFDLERELAPLYGPSLYTEEILRLHGRSRLEPLGEVTTFRSAAAAQGFLVALSTRLGKPEPWLVQGLGEVTIGGELRQGTQPLAWSARGNQGLLLTHDPVTGRLRGCLGPSTAEASHEFVFSTDQHDVRGRGLVLLDAEPAAEPAGSPGEGRFEVRFLAAVREDLHLRLREAGDRTEIDGVKSARLVHAAPSLERVELGGTPVEVRGARGVRGRAEIVERIADGPWLFRKVSAPVEVELPGDARRGAVRLAAAEVALRLLARWPGGGERGDLWVRATGDATTEVRVVSAEPDLSTRVEVTCARLVFLPWLLPPLVSALDATTLGGASQLAGAAAAGGDDGWFRAESDVRVLVHEEPPGGGARQHAFGGETLLLDAARTPVRCLLLPGPSGLVTATLEEPGRGAVRLLGDRLSVQGDEIVLGSAGSSPRVYLVPERGALAATPLGTGRRAARVLRVAAAGAVRYDGRTLRFPGPVLAEAVGEDDQRLPEDFVLTCRRELLVTLAEAASPRARQPEAPEAIETAGLALPHSVQRVAARGDVRAAYMGLTARGDELGLDPGTGWLDLERALPGVVTVDLDGSWRMRARERLSVNLVTREVRSGEGRIDGLLGQLVR